MKLDKDTFRLTDTGGIAKLAYVVAAIGLVLSGLCYVLRPDAFFPAYLVALVFWVSIGLGGLFFTLLHHLVDATWSVVIRRVVETAMVTLPLMAIFFIPIIFGMQELYHWSDPVAVAHDELLQKKQAFLNPTFFWIRSFAYFFIWFVISRILYATSLRQDGQHTEEILSRLKCTSGPGMAAFAITITFASFDWLMSLDPHWYSTIFGVYIFAGSLLSILAFVTLFAAVLRRKGVLDTEITVEHFHDLGKLLFAFTIFWAYIAFCQYFLIWYGNIPEETIWFRHRWEGGWKCVTLFIVFGHFVLPFVILLSRVPKRNVLVLSIMSVWMLVVHWVDLYWIIMPNFNHHFHVGIAEVGIYFATFVGVGATFFALFWRTFTAHPVIPINDPKLQASVRFVNT